MLQVSEIVSVSTFKQVKANLKRTFIKAPYFSIDVSWQVKNCYKEDGDLVLFQYYGNYMQDTKLQDTGFSKLYVF